MGNNGLAVGDTEGEEEASRTNLVSSHLLPGRSCSSSPLLPASPAPNCGPSSPLLGPANPLMQLSAEDIGPQRELP